MWRWKQTTRFPGWFNAISCVCLSFPRPFSSQHSVLSTPSPLFSCTLGRWEQPYAGSASWVFNYMFFSVFFFFLHCPFPKWLVIPLRLVASFEEHTPVDSTSLFLQRKKRIICSNYFPWLGQKCPIKTKGEGLIWVQLQKIWSVVVGSHTLVKCHSGASCPSFLYRQGAEKWERRR